MTNQEFSDEFDILYNNITSNQAPGLDEYEKSVFLTKALDEIVKAYFDPKLNKVQEGFDGSERRLIDFSMLMRTVEGTNAEPTINIYAGSNTKYYAMPTDILIYINEILTVNRNGHSVNLVVVPLAYNEYNRLMSKPFKRPLKNLAWRIISSGAANSYIYTDYSAIATAIASDTNVTASANTIFSYINNLELSISGNKVKVGIKYIEKNGTLGNTGVDLTNSTKTIINSKINNTVASSSTVVELIPGPNDITSKYIIRYIARPRPIILTDLSSEGVSLGNGETSVLSCTLDPIIHHEILQRAVELAKAANVGDLNSAVLLGVNSGTPIGMLASK